MFPQSEVQADSLRTEHSFRFLLPDKLHLFRTAAVKDVFKVHIKDDVRQARNDLTIAMLLVIIPAQLTHDLEEQGVAVLLMGYRFDLAFLRCSPAEMKCVLLAVCQNVTHDRPGGQFIDSVFGHPLTSRIILL